MDRDCTPYAGQPAKVNSYIRRIGSSTRTELVSDTAGNRKTGP